jgi:hypothetical protein
MASIATAPGGRFSPPRASIPRRPCPTSGSRSPSART